MLEVSDTVRYLDNSTTPRCQGTTKSGAQCKKAAQAGFDSCAQHDTIEPTEQTELEALHATADSEAQWEALKAIARRESERRMRNYQARAEAKVRKHGRVVERTAVPSGAVLRNDSERGKARRARRAAKRVRRFGR